MYSKYSSKSLCWLEGFQNMGKIGGKNRAFSRQKKMDEGVMVNMAEADAPIHPYKGRYQHAGILADI